MILVWLSVVGGRVVHAAPPAPAPAPAPAPEAVAPAGTPALVPEIVAYVERIRLGVASRWQWNLDTLPASVRLAGDRFVTVVDVRLAADGGLADLVVRSSSGSPELDDCVVRAFRSAAPFAPPPAALPTRDGIVRLPPFDFTVMLRPVVGRKVLAPLPPGGASEGRDDELDEDEDEDEDEEVRTTLHL